MQSSVMHSAAGPRCASLRTTSSCRASSVTTPSLCKPLRPAQSTLLCKPCPARRTTCQSSSSDSVESAKQAEGGAKQSSESATDAPASEVKEVAPKPKKKIDPEAAAASQQRRESMKVKGGFPRLPSSPSADGEMGSNNIDM